MGNYIAKINYDNLVAKTDRIIQDLNKAIDSVSSDIKENAKAISEFVNMTTDPVCIIYDRTGDAVLEYSIRRNQYPSRMYLTSGGTSVIPEKYLSNSIVTTKYYINRDLVHIQTDRLSDLGQGTITGGGPDDVYARIFEIPIADIPYKDNFQAPVILIVNEARAFNHNTGYNFPSNGVYLGTTVYDVIRDIEQGSYTTYEVEVSCIDIEGVYNRDKQISNKSVEGFSELKSDVATLQTRSRTLQSEIGNLNTNVDSLKNDMFTILSSGMTEGTTVTIESGGESFKHSGTTYTHCSEIVVPSDNLNSGIIRVEWCELDLGEVVISTRQAFPVQYLYCETFTHLGEIYARKIVIPKPTHELADIFEEASVLLIINASIFNQFNEQLGGKMKNGIYFCRKRPNNYAGGRYITTIQSLEFLEDGVPYAKIKDGMLLENSEFKELLARVEALEKKH